MDLVAYRKILRGISGVHATAYDADGGIDAGLTGSIVGRIAGAGVHNIVTGGNTGEFYSMSVEEVIRLQAIAIKAVDGRAAVTAAAGRSIRDAIEISKAASAEGANGVMVHHPLDPFAAPHAQVDYFIAIAEAIDVPVVAYIRSDLVPLDDMVRLATHPNVAGVKFASQNAMLFFECCRATKGSEATWICGLAESWALPFYALGGRGFTSGLVNVAPQRSLAVWNALEAGDYARARAVVESIADFEAMRTKYRNGANVTVVKEALQIQGFAVGDVRLPGLPRLEPQDRAALQKIIAGWESDAIA
ncbi:dihydrodipicolinate synthase family protein [Falsochrobactrum sp. TDYN1]|uniref:Dihydrodipicolinate synthase family protein n=1 Tax=Falsochrobactrum tianjinense TaxID=2706015 RepID=A0A949UUK6_9HYPH|nr:dihydrodipicolinate synthase family protein [Falsochrobactrum sp. TDYN1]MBV2145020.1 dihydrodipicolinate synthase family protein [Falsochrobactrum sp. TDYN1]